MILLTAIVVYALFVFAGIKFFRQVHRWDEQASRMWNEELLRLEQERKHKRHDKNRSKRIAHTV